MGTPLKNSPNTCTYEEMGKDVRGTHRACFWRRAKASGAQRLVRGVGPGVLSKQQYGCVPRLPTSLFSTGFGHGATYGSMYVCT